MIEGDAGMTGGHGSEGRQTPPWIWDETLVSGRLLEYEGWIQCSEMLFGTVRFHLVGPAASEGQGINVDQNGTNERRYRSQVFREKGRKRRDCR